MRTRASVVLLTLLLFTPSLASVFEAGMNPGIGSSQIIDQNVYLAGNIIAVNGIVNGDVIVGGNIVEITGQVDGDVWVGANTVTINGDVSGDVRCGASIVTVGGNIGGELLAGAGIVSISEGASVGEVNVGTASLSIAGTVIGNVTAAAENVSISDTASIGGILNYTSSADAEIADPSVISGTVQRNEPKTSSMTMPWEDYLWSLSYIGIFFFVMALLGKLLVGWILLKISEKWIKNTRMSMNKDVFSQMVRGFGFLILVPIAAIIGFITVIAAPISLMGLAIYGVLLYIAKIIGAFWLGMKVLEWLKIKKKPIMLELLIGILALEGIALIPFVGWLIG